MSQGLNRARRWGYKFFEWVFLIGGVWALVNSFIGNDPPEDDWLWLGLAFALYLMAKDAARSYDSVERERR